MSVFLKKQKIEKKEKYILATYEVSSKRNINDVAHDMIEQAMFGFDVFDKVAQDFGETAFVYKTSAKQGLVYVAFPVSYFEAGNLPQLLSLIAGRIFSVEGAMIRLIDIELPKKYQGTFYGPRYSISDLHTYVGTGTHRPLFSIRVEPAFYFSPKEHAEYVEGLYEAGIDIVLDSPIQTAYPRHRFGDRVRRVLDVRAKMEAKLEQRFFYGFNVTAPPEVLYERAEVVSKMGGRLVLIDALATGLDNIHMLRKSQLPLFVMADRMGFSCYDRIDISVLNKLGRLVGVDIMHLRNEQAAGGLKKAGKRQGKKILEGQGYLFDQGGPHKNYTSVIGGQLSVHDFKSIYDLVGNDAIIDITELAYGHPDGVAAGIEAAREAMHAALLRKSLDAHAKNIESLKVLL
jgi:ribulose-bisphosphate carboxylase large chain